MNVFEIVFFGVCSLLVLGGGIVTVASLSPIRGAMGLLGTIVGIAGMYLGLYAEFLAAVQILVYAGAVVVLFLFVIMLLGAESLASTNSLPWQKPMAILLSVILGVEAVYLLLNRAGSNLAVAAPDASLNSMDSLREMAMSLFNNFLLPFEVTSILLLVAMMGAIVLTRQEKEAK